MFLKPFRVKTQSALKNSDRKKLRTDIRLQFPSITEEDAFGLIPPKDEMSVAKVATGTDEVAQIFYVQKMPVIFESFKKYYPTVYTLWKYPDLLPNFRTWPQVFPKLQNGADLMLPGVIYDKGPSPKMFGNLEKGDLVTISLAGNKSPVAIGHALLSGEDMYLSALKGKGVGIIHILGDALWEAGDKSKPPMQPDSFTEQIDEEEGEEKVTKEKESEANDEKNTDEATHEIEKLELDSEVSETTAEENVNQSENDKINDEEEEEVEEEKDPVSEMDELLHFCFACAIKSRIKDSDLPILTVNLIRDFMQPFSSPKRLDIKKSSFKKLSRFLQLKVDEAFITVQEQTKGVDAITTIDRDHPRLKDLDVPEAVEEETANEAGATAQEEEILKPLTFTDVYCINANTADVFRGTQYSKGDALILAHVREAVIKYIEQNDLYRKDDTKMVILDPILAHTILKSSEGDLDHMPQEQVVNRVMGKMTPGVAISSSEGLIKIKKDKLQPIKLDVSMRASNKKINNVYYYDFNPLHQATVVENLEDYGFDLKAFARTVQRGISCSCTVNMPQQKDKGPVVVVQGNQITYLGKLLLEKCKIPRKYVTGLDKAPKQKKKK